MLSTHHPHSFETPSSPRWRRLALAAWLAGLLLSASPAAQAGTLPHALELPPDWYPESLALGPDDSLYVGSWRQGAVVRLDAAGGPPQLLVPPGSQGLSNGQGVLVDAPRDTLWICSGDIGYTTVAPLPSALKRYRLSDGAPQGSYAMPEAGYCNDLAADTQGRLYVTDSRHPRVLRLDPDEPAQTAQLRPWIEDPLLAGAGPEVGPYLGLNGIAPDGEDGFVLSTVAAAPRLLHVQLLPDGRAGAVSTLEAPRQLRNVDAIRAWTPGHWLLFESNAFGAGSFGGQITAARLHDGRLDLRTVVSGLNDPSSGLIHAGRVYFIESKYRLLTQDGHSAPPPGVPFDLQSRELPGDF